MRVINLDETGIKIISSTKQQLYLSKQDIIEFIQGNYTLTKDKLMFKENSLEISEIDYASFPNIFSYIQSNFITQ